MAVRHAERMRRIMLSRVDSRALRHLCTYLINAIISEEIYCTSILTAVPNIFNQVKYVQQTLNDVSSFFYCVAHGRAAE
jgi:hypothetical protein